MINSSCSSQKGSLCSKLIAFFCSINLQAM
uniref:Uncharacterized protein n=1 Tax=Arundo donax TaxID=35708 RepID=A0A0A9BCM8_ARUDO